MVACQLRGYGHESSYVSVLCGVLLISCFIGIARSMSIDEAILTDMLDDGSPNCVDTGETSWSTTYSSSISTSGWDSYISESLERMNFQAIMTHKSSGQDNSNDWKIRISKGGNIYSHVNELLGELTPPQARSDQSAWIDEVTQMVSVDQTKNFKILNTLDNQNETFAHYVHQAGVYNRESSLPPMFFSPNTAMHCAGNSCSFASWGQHAHVPTIFESDILYFTRYRNCGGGVMEITQGHYNTGYKVNDRIKYTNTPWAAFRSTKLGTSQRTNSDGTLQAEMSPLPYWGSTEEGNSITETKFSGGFHVLSEPIPDYEEKFICIQGGVGTDPVEILDPCTQADIDTGSWTRFQLIARTIGATSNFCQYREVQNDIQCGTYENTLNFPTNSGSNYGHNIEIKNRRTGEIVFVASKVKHWFWRTTTSSFFEGVTEDITTINGKIQAGDELYAVPQIVGFGDRTADTKMALTWVHGKHPDLDFSHRTRAGVAGNAARDFVILTMNAYAGLDIGPHEMYWNREFYAFGRHADAETTGNSLVDDTDYGVKKYPHEWSGRKIGLYSSSSSSTFRAYAPDGKVQPLPGACGDEILQCEGMSTATAGYEAFFAIKCGGQFYVGPDQYHFTPSYTQYDTSVSLTGDNIVRPYNITCGESPGERASFQLLGFFSTSTCSGVAGKEYDPSPCPTDSPSGSPSTTPTISQSPSKSPSDIPSVLPSTIPSGAPSEPPSLSPSDIPSDIPSTGPSDSPSVSPSSPPSKSPSVIPSTSPSLSPSAVPSESPSHSPSGIPSAIPSTAPSESPSFSPSAPPSKSPSVIPSTAPSESPSVSPSESPSGLPSFSPSSAPSNSKPQCEADGTWTLSGTCNPDLCCSGQCEGGQPSRRKCAPTDGEPPAPTPTPPPLTCDSNSDKPTCKSDQCQSVGCQWSNSGKVCNSCAAGAAVEGSNVFESKNP